MKLQVRWLALSLAALLLLPAATLMAQSRGPDIEDTKRLLQENPTLNNRVRLGTLYYLEGVDYLLAGNSEAAVENLQSAVWTLEDGAGQVPDTNAVFEEARYGLGYAQLQAGNPYEALGALDPAVKANPEFHKARYLLGVTLLGIPTRASQTRGLEVLKLLAQESDGDIKAQAERSALRFAYNTSTAMHAQGNAAGAAALLQGVTDALGSDLASNMGENEKVQFAAGVYLADSGDAFGAIDAYEKLYNTNSGFSLSNGVTVASVLSNTYYQAGLDQLDLGAGTASLVAVDLFDSAATVGDPKAVDVHHGKAVAYSRAEDAENMVAEIKMIAELDPGYFAKIQKK